MTPKIESFPYLKALSPKFLDCYVAAANEAKKSTVDDTRCLGEMLMQLVAVCKDAMRYRNEMESRNLK